MNQKMLGDLMQQAQAMQGHMARIQKEAAQKTVTATTGGGMVCVTANGQQEIVSLTIDPEIIQSGDVDMLRDLILSGVNEVLRKSKAMMSEELKALGLPNLF